MKTQNLLKKSLVKTKKRNDILNLGLLFAHEKGKKLLNTFARVFRSVDFSLLLLTPSFLLEVRAATKRALLVKIKGKTESNMK